MEALQHEPWPHQQLRASRPAAAQQRDVLSPAAHGTLHQRPKAAQCRDALPLFLQPPAAHVLAPRSPRPARGSVCVVYIFAISLASGTRCWPVNLVTTDPETAAMRHKVCMQPLHMSASWNIVRASA